VKVHDFAAEIDVPQFLDMIRHFLYNQLHPDWHQHVQDIPIDFTPPFDGKISLHPSAVATFYAPSDPSGVGGMRREYIRATSSWCKTPRYDCILVNSDPDTEAMHGLKIAQVVQFFSFQFRSKMYPCALVHWFSRVSDVPDEYTGMWIVEKEVDPNGNPALSVIHLDCVLRAAHLIGEYGKEFVPNDLKFHESLDTYETFFVNKFADYHAFATV
jgi:hypothetical protein